MRYVVLLTRTVTEETRMYVEADTPEEAGKLAEHDADDATWRATDVDDMKVVKTVEL